MTLPSTPRFSVIAALLAAAALAVAPAPAVAAGGDGEVGAAVFGGYRAQKNRYPWHGNSVVPAFKVEEGFEDYIYLALNESVAWCGLTLIHPRVAVTAGHCVLNEGRWYDSLNSSLIGITFPKIRFNAYRTDLKDMGTVRRNVIATAVHARWDKPEFLQNDLALMLLDRPVKGPVARLPRGLKRGAPPEASRGDLTLIGFGASSYKYVLAYDTEDGSPYVDAREQYPALLQEVPLRLNSPRTCWAAYSYRNIGYWGKNNDTFLTNICAGEPWRLTTSCSGDSGGPLFRKGRTASQDELIGVVSYGDGSGCGTKKPSVFVNVAHYRGWIDKGIKILLGKARNDPALYRLRRKK